MAIDLFGKKALKQKDILIKKAVDEIHAWEALASTCIFCGVRCATTVGLKDHSAKCEKHPLMKQLNDTKQLLAIATSAVEMLNNPEMSIRGYVFRMRNDDGKRECRVGVDAVSKTEAKEKIRRIMHASWKTISIDEPKEEATS